jgi:hypothetical protein
MRPKEESRVAVERLSRREFIQVGALTGAALALPGGGARAATFPEAEKLGRVTEPEVDLYARPTPESRVVARRRFDEVVVAERQIVGLGIQPHNHLWVETPEGFIWSPYLQPVKNEPNAQVPEVPEGGLWTEIAVPYVDGLREADAASAVRYRLYYSMILNVDQRVVGADGKLWYRVHDENGIRMFAAGESFRVIQPEELETISPGVEEKTIYVDLERQDLSAVEAGVEVYYARISSGYAFDEEGRRRWNTPVGNNWTWRKMVSRHMSGGDRVSGYDLPGVGWTILFSGTGAAIHSTYWHNDFGTPRSRGCINVAPEDGKWLFRWSNPPVPYRPGDVTIADYTGTRVIVSE